LRNLEENFSNMSLKDYLDGVIYFFEKRIFFIIFQNVGSISS
jgi:hypothetical protein